MPEMMRHSGGVFWRPLPRSFRAKAAQSVRSVLLETSRRTAGAKSYLFTEPLATLEPRTPGELQATFARIEAEVAGGRWIAGYFAYEAGYALEPTLSSWISGDGRLAWIGIFDSIEVFDHASDGPWEKREAVRAITEAVPQLSHTPEDYALQVMQVREWIAAGETYQANLSMEAWWPATDGLTAFTAAMASQPVEYGAWLRLGNGEEIISASPELFFRHDGRGIRTRPMKGTASRGLSLEEDDQRALWLQRDEKNRAENVMIVDLLRSDLGRVCEIGSVEVERMFEVERFPTLLQMTSDVVGTLRAGLGTGEIFRALFPPGSIVGAPKVHTMELLQKLENRHRGVYTGSIGWEGPENFGTWNVAIRTIHQVDGKARMGVGSGLLWDSEASSEFDECRTKLAFLCRESQPFELVETLLWDHGYARLDAHIARVKLSALYFGIPFIETDMRFALQKASAACEAGKRWRVRLLLDESGRFSVTATEVVE